MMKERASKEPTKSNELPDHSLDVAALERFAEQLAAEEREKEERRQQEREKEAETRRRYEEAEARRRYEETEARRRYEEAESRRRYEEAEARRRYEEAEDRRRYEEVEARRRYEEAQVGYCLEKTRNQEYEMAERCRRADEEEERIRLHFDEKEKDRVESEERHAEYTKWQQQRYPTGSTSKLKYYDSDNLYQVDKISNNGSEKTYDEYNVDDEDALYSHDNLMFQELKRERYDQHFEKEFEKKEAKKAAKGEPRKNAPNKFMRIINRVKKIFVSKNPVEKPDYADHKPQEHVISSNCPGFDTQEKQTEKKEEISGRIGLTHQIVDEENIIEQDLQSPHVHRTQEYEKQEFKSSENVLITSSGKEQTENPSSSVTQPPEGLRRSARLAAKNEPTKEKDNKNVEEKPKSDKKDDSAQTPSGIITCFDNEGKPVKFWIILKFPNKKNGYNYLDSKMVKAQVTEMKHFDDITSTETALHLTLQQYFKDDKDLIKIAYNDQQLRKVFELNKDSKQFVQIEKMFPISNKGHMKGILAYKNGNGIFMTHSVPGLPAFNTNKFPDNGLLNGQHAVCININEKVFKVVTKHIIVAEPAYTKKGNQWPEEYSNIRDIIENDVEIIKNENPTSSFSDLNKEGSVLFNQIHTRLNNKRDEDSLNAFLDEVADFLANNPYSSANNVSDENTKNDVPENDENSVEIAKKNDSKNDSCDDEKQRASSEDENGSQSKRTDPNSGFTDDKDNTDTAENPAQISSTAQNDSSISEEKPHLELHMQTWRNEKQKCQKEDDEYKGKKHYVHNVKDVQEIQVTGTNLKWKHTCDHSKYGISNDDKMLIFSDVNHTNTHKARGGSVYCIKNEEIVKIVKATIEYTLDAEKQESSGSE